MTCDSDGGHAAGILERLMQAGAAMPCGNEPRVERISGAGGAHHSHFERRAMILVRLTAPPVAGGVLLGMQAARLDESGVREALIRSVAGMLDSQHRGPGVVA